MTELKLDLSFQQGEIIIQLKHRIQSGSLIKHLKNENVQASNCKLKNSLQTNISSNLVTREIFLKIRHRASLLKGLFVKSITLGDNSSSHTIPLDFGLFGDLRMKKFLPPKNLLITTPTNKIGRIESLVLSYKNQFFGLVPGLDNHLHPFRIFSKNKRPSL